MSGYLLPRRTSPGGAGLVPAAGLLSGLPANGATPDGSLYFATDQNGGTLYQQVAGVQTPVAPGASQASAMIAGPVQLTASFDVKAVGTTITDVTGMTLAVPASARPVLLRFKGEAQFNTGTAAAAAALTIQTYITDASNNAIAESPVSAQQVTAAAVVLQGTILVEAYLPAPVAAATYKIRAKTLAAVPANWTTATILPANGAIAGADNFYALAV